MFCPDGLCVSQTGRCRACFDKVTCSVRRVDGFMGVKKQISHVNGKLPFRLLQNKNRTRASEAFTAHFPL